MSASATPVARHWRVIAPLLLCACMQPAHAMQDPPPGSAKYSAQAAQPAPSTTRTLRPLTQDAAPPQATPSTAPADTTQAVVLQPSTGSGPQAAATAPAPSADAAGAAQATPRGILFRITPPATASTTPQSQGDASTDAESDDAVLEDAMVVAGTAPPAQAPASDKPPAAEAASSVASKPIAAVAPLPPAKPSYLLGTIHFGKPEEQGIDYALLEALLRQSTAFVNEIDVAEAWKPEYDAYRWMDAAQPLSGMLGGEQFASLRTLLPKVEAGTLERSKPWAVLSLLEARGERADADTMDHRLQTMASAGGVSLVHLESLQAQLQALNCVPDDEQAQVLSERLREPWILRIESAEAMRHYRSRNLGAWLADVDRMDGLSASGRAIEHRARECLLEARNRAWLPALMAQLAQGGRFVAVGAIHLPGPNGLLAALLRAGYTVEAQPL